MRHVEKELVVVTWFVRKERTVFAKQRAEVYSRERYTIIKKEANMCTLSGEDEGRDIPTNHY